MYLLHYLILVNSFLLMPVFVVDKKKNYKLLQAWYLFLVAASLVARTYADVWMIQNGTAIERFVRCYTE